MDYAVLLGALAVVIAVKALTAMALNKQELMLKRVTGDDRELGSKIAALNATERQLTREKKASEEQLQELEAEKDRLLLAIQKFGATPVEEPTEEEVFGFRNQTTVPAGPVSTDKVGEKGPDGTLLDEPGGVVEEDEERAGDAAAPDEPLSPASASLQGEAGSGATAETSEHDENSKIRVLIVDDNSELRDLLAEALGEGYAIEGAPDGLDALHQLVKKELHYDVVMTDLNMPHIDGIALLDRLPEGIPAIVMSAYLDRPEFAAALNHPRATRVLEKPFRLSDVRSAIESAVEKPSEEEEAEAEAETPTAS